MEPNKTFERLKKMISKGLYEADSIKLDLDDFLEMGTISEDAYLTLLELFDEVSSEDSETNVPATYSNAVDSTYILLKKQITKGVYAHQDIKQMITDFRIASTISRAQFIELKELIKSIYEPIIKDDSELEMDELF